MISISKKYTDLSFMWFFCLWVALASWNISFTLYYSFSFGAPGMWFCLKSELSIKTNYIVQVICKYPQLKKKNIYTEGNLSQQRYNKYIGRSI